MNPTLSIICAVANGEAYLKKNLESLLSQNLQDVEIIYVNDGSIDQTEEILRNAEKENTQIKVISLNENRSASYARKIGFKQSKGKYIWFIDADDEISENAVDELLEYLKKYSVDILHFNSKIIDCGAGTRRCKDKAEFDKPNLKYLENKNILEDCFIKKNHGFNLWNKVFSYDVCELAMDSLEDGKFLKANDLYLYFLIAFFAKSYQGIDSSCLYFYSYGSGSTGHDIFTHEQFILMCQEYEILCALERFIHNNYSETNNQALFFVRCRILNDCIVAWKRRVPKKDKKKEFLYLMNYIGANNTVFAINLTYFNDLDSIISDIENTELFQHNKKNKNNNVALFIPDKSKIIWSIVNGIISNLKKHNNNIILITDDEECQNYFNNYFNILLIQKSDRGNELFYERVNELCYILKSKKISNMVYINYMASAIFYDCFLIKALGVNLDIFNFEYIFSNITQLRKGGAFLLQAMKLADSIETFYQSDVKFWNNYGIDVIPVKIDRIMRQKETKDYYHIVWEGSFQNPQYNFYDSIEIVERLSKIIPNIKLDILCYDVTDEQIEKFEKRAEMFHVSQNICVHVDPINNNYLYYNADVCLVTSCYEIFPKTLVEAEKYDIPVVIYDQICLEEFANKILCISVQPKNYFYAANAVKDIILNYNPPYNNDIQYLSISEKILFHYKWAVIKYKRLSAKNKKLEKKLFDLQEKYNRLEEQYEQLCNLEELHRHQKKKQKRIFALQKRKK